MLLIHLVKLQSKVFSVDLSVGVSAAAVKIQVSVADAQEMRLMNRCCTSSSFIGTGWPLHIKRRTKDGSEGFSRWKAALLPSGLARVLFNTAAHCSSPRGGDRKSVV